MRAIAASTASTGESSRERIRSAVSLADRYARSSVTLIATLLRFASVAQMSSGRPLSSERLAASETRSASVACAPVASVGASPRSSQSATAAVCPAQGSALDDLDEAHRTVRRMHAQAVRGLVDTADVAAVGRRGRAERVLDDPALAEHAQVARERVGVRLHQAALHQSPRRPRARRSRRSAAARRSGPLRRARANTRRGGPSTAESVSKSCTIRSTQTPPERAASIIQSFQAGGGESRSALAASGRPSSPDGDDPPQLDVLGPEAQHEADDEQLAGALGRRDDRLGILERERDRLLQQHVLAGGECALGGLAVLRRRQADVDHVDVRPRRAARRDRPSPRPRRAPPRARRAPASATTRRRPARDRASADQAPACVWPMKPPPTIATLIIPGRARSGARRRAAIDAFTSASGGHGSPWNSISTESGPR